MGVKYSLRSEYAYVTGPAVVAAGCTPGTRDEGNAGKRPADFQRDRREVNELIKRPGAPPAAEAAAAEPPQTCEKGCRVTAAAAHRRRGGGRRARVERR